MAPWRNMWPGRGPRLCWLIMEARFPCSDPGWQAAAMVAKAAWTQVRSHHGQVGLRPLCGEKFMRSLP